jgi:hypothetical protein
MNAITPASVVQQKRNPDSLKTTPRGRRGKGIWIR